MCVWFTLNESLKINVLHWFMQKMTDLWAQDDWPWSDGNLESYTCIINCWSLWHYFWAIFKCFVMGSFYISESKGDCHVLLVPFSSIQVEGISFRFSSSSIGNEKAIPAALYLHAFLVVGIEVRLRNWNLVPEFCATSTQERVQTEDISIWYIAPVPILGNSVTIIGIYQRLTEKEKTQVLVKRGLSAGDNFGFVGTLCFSIVFWGLLIFWLMQLLKCSIAKATF